MHNSRPYVFASFSLPQRESGWISKFQILIVSYGKLLYWVLGITYTPTKFLVIPQEINLPYDLSLPGKPRSKSRIFHFGMTVFCYITNYGYFRLCFEAKALFLDSRRQQEVFCRSEHGSVVWQLFLMKSLESRYSVMKIRKWR